MTHLSIFVFIEYRKTGKIEVKKQFQCDARLALENPKRTRHAARTRVDAADFIEGGISRLGGGATTAGGKRRRPVGQFRSFDCF